MKKFITLALALCMALSASVCASAAEISSDGGSGRTPVYLSSTEDGTMEGEPAATAMIATTVTTATRTTSAKARRRVAVATAG